MAIPSRSSAQADSPWQPFRAAPFDLPAGSRCSFPLSGRIVEDGERIRTTEVNADGSRTVTLGRGTVEDVAETLAG